MKLASMLVVVLVGACTQVDPPPAPASPPAKSLPTDEVAPAPEPQTPPSKPKADRISCRTDLDCQACASERGCGCKVVAADGACPPTIDSCFAPPCGPHSASCWAGHCVLRDGAAGPCDADAQCVVRADRCHCDLHAVLASAAPPRDECEAVGCGAEPNPADFVARCDPTARRCVLDRAPAVPGLSVVLTCETHGTALTTRRIEVVSSPPSIRVQDGDAVPVERTLSPEALTSLRDVLASADFARFVEETPAPGPPHPGMSKCRLHVESPTSTVEDKRWMSGDAFSGPAASARAALHTELEALARPRPDAR